MEGIEVSVSENLDSINSELYTLEEIRHTNLNFLNIDEYPLHPCIHNKQELAWHVGKRLYCDEPWMIPAEMLSLDFTMNNAKGQAPRTFRTTSNGLASGRTKTEAIVSALLETIERHSVTLNNKILGNYTRLEIGKNCPQTLGKILEELAENDVNVAIFDATTIKGLHAVEAFLWSPSGVIPNTAGSGCSVNLEVAILRAVLEANQAATLILSGSRDDLTKQVYLMTELASHIDLSIAKMTKHKRYLENTDFHFTEISQADELDLIASKITKSIDREIIVYNYTPDSYPVCVCKVFIPTLEGYYTEGYRSNYKPTTSITHSEPSTQIRLAAGGQL